MFNDVFNPNLQFLNDLHINPIPLEYKNGMTPTVWLGEMQATLTMILAKVNGWYDEILNDIDNGGALYQHIIEHIDSEFTGDLNALTSQLNALSSQLNTALDTINAQLTILSYVKPQVAITINPNVYVYTIGENINSVVINFNAIKGSNNFVKAELYKNNTLISTLTNIVEGSNTMIDGSVINNDTEYFIRLYDDKGYVESNHMSYDFVYNFIYGICNSTDTINSDLLLTLSQLKTSKGTVQESFSGTDKIIVFAFDSSYGNLSSINYNDINIIDAFTQINVNVNSIPYIVYKSNNAVTINNLSLTFKYE